MGFLGEGTVIHTKGAVYDLTTAATIQTVAAVGMAVATDLYLIGIVTTMMTTGVLALLAPLSKQLADRAEARQQQHVPAVEKKEAGENQVKASDSE